MEPPSVAVEFGPAHTHLLLSLSSPPVSTPRLPLSLKDTLAQRIETVDYKTASGLKSLGHFYIYKGKRKECRITLSDKPLQIKEKIICT